jgi:cytochrome P450
VVRWELGVGFFRMDDIVAAGRNPDLASTDPATGVPFGMGSTDPLIPLHLDGDVHRHYRKLLDPLFTPRKMAVLEPDIRKLADELIDGFVGRGRVEFHDAFCVPLPSTIFLRLFGMPLEDMDLLIAMKDRPSTSSTGASPTTGSRRGTRSATSSPASGRRGTCR